MFAVLPASQRHGPVQPVAPVLASVAHVVLIMLGITLTSRAISSVPHVALSDPAPFYMAPQPLPKSPSTVSTPSATPSAARATAAIPLSVPTVTLDLPVIATARPAVASTDGMPPGVVRGVATARLDAVDPGRVLRLNEVDEPVRLIRSVTPDYPPGMRALGREGEVRLRYIVDTLGRIEAQSVVVLASSDTLFTLAATRALESLRFAPAQAGGRLVRQLAEQVIRFSINR